MATTAGEFFVELGIKGSDKTIGALTDTRKGMGDLASTSLEARAAMVAAAYAFEQMMSASAHYGTAVQNSSLLLGVGTKELQKYHYAAQMAGASVEEMNGSFKRLSDIATNIHLNKGVPEGLKMINNLLGPNAIDIKRIDDLPYMLQKLQEVAANTKLPAGLRRRFLEEMLGSDNMVAAVIKQSFGAQVLNNAPFYSTSQLSQLDKARSAWTKIANQVTRAFGLFNARHGASMATEIGQVVTATSKLAEALDGLAERLQVFKGFAIVMNGLAGSMQIVANLASDKKETREAERNEIGNFFSDLGLMADKFFGENPYVVAGLASSAQGGLPNIGGGLAGGNTTTDNRQFNFNGVKYDEAKRFESFLQRVHDSKPGKAVRGSIAQSHSG